MCPMSKEQSEAENAAEEWAAKEFPPTDFKNQYNWQSTFMENRKAFLAGAAWAAPKWVRCSDRLPELDQTCLVALQVPGQTRYKHDYGERMHGNSWSLEFLDIEELGWGITHWQPLPAAPEVEK